MGKHLPWSFLPNMGLYADLRMHTVTTKRASSELCLNLTVLEESNVSIFRIVPDYLSLLPFFDSLDYMSRNTSQCQRHIHLFLTRAYTSTEPIDQGIWSVSLALDSLLTSTALDPVLFSGLSI